MEEAMVRRHLEACDPCRLRHDELARLSDRFSDLVRDLEVAATVKSPRTRQRFPRPFLALLILGVIAYPAAGFAAQVARSLWRALNPPRVTSFPNAPSYPSGTALAFRTSSRVLEFEVLMLQSAGTLELTVGDAEVVSLAVTGGSPNEIIVGEGRVQIRNTQVASTSYVVTLPRHVHELRIRVGGREPRSFTIGQLQNTGLAVSLQSGSISPRRGPTAAP
jgi:hypothetical protein